MQQTVNNFEDSITQRPRRLMWALLCILGVALTGPAYAQQGPEQQTQDTFYKGEITDVVETTTETGLLKQDITLTLQGGDRDGEVVTSENILSGQNDGWRQFHQGDRVVVLESTAISGTVYGVPAATDTGERTVVYFVTDYYRLPRVIWAILLFFALAVVIAGRKGLFSIVGLVLSVVVIAGFMVPQLAAGQSPLVIGGIGAFVISIASLYVAHGFNARTTLSLAGMVITIILAIVLSWLSVHSLQLFGVGSEEAYALQFGLQQAIDLRGLLLAGILIGSLGVLDDVTTALVATVAEIHDANPSLTYQHLLRKAWNVGVEHIASLINTLVLAYAGTSLPLLLLFTLDYQPFWVTMNGQYLAEEVVRTLVGSTAILLAIPISTVLAAWYYAKRSPHRAPQ